MLSKSCFALSVLLLVFSPAQAAFCLLREDLETVLWRDYKEELVSTSQAKNGLYLSMYVSKTGTWTAVYWAPQYTRACIVDSGKGWQWKLGVSL